MVLAASKIFSLDKLPEVIDRHDRKIVLAHGCFDPLHAGHVKHLEEAKGMGDVLVVTVTGDYYAEKGPNRPAFPAEMRAIVVAALECVDFVAINNYASAIKAIALVRPNVYVKGREYFGHTTKLLAGEMQAVEVFGGQVRYTSNEIRLSSTEMLRRLTECV